VLTHSFEDLAQTFRVLLESNCKFQQLITVDRPEAVGTIETAINAKLNAFHNLYDLMLQDLGNPVDWYSTPQLCVILAIRNARHHNKANRIRSIYNFHTQTCDSPTDKRNYLYVDFPANPEEDGGDFFNVPLSWGDLDAFLSLPRNNSRLGPKARELVRTYLNAEEFETEADRGGIRKEHIFFNFVPLTLNAGIAIQPYVKDHVTPDSVESKSFLDLFGSIGAAVTTQHEYEILEFSLPK
jgi:hypothetical protein